MKTTLATAFLILAFGIARGLDENDSTEGSDEHGQFRGEKDTTCPCGWTNKVKGRIVGGKRTSINEYPYMASLMIVNMTDKNERCGAGILTAKHALTAAHCTHKSDQLTYDYLFLLVGDSNVRGPDRTSPYAAVHYVKRFVEHPQYNPATLKNDLSILITDTPMWQGLNPGVGPLCLPTGPMHQFLVSRNAVLKIAGWGKLSTNSSYSDYLMKINLNVVPLKRCQDAFQPHGFNLDVDNPTQICVHSDTVDSCNGDSGGPLVWLDPETNRYTLVATVSFGHPDCGSGVPSVNTDVSYYHAWIQETIAGSRLGLQTCSKEG